ncbi:unnamed protein product [Arabidopsis halleri]
MARRFINAVFLTTTVQRKRRRGDLTSTVVCMLYSFDYPSWRIYRVEEDECCEVPFQRLDVHS